MRGNRTKREKAKRVVVELNWEWPRKHRPSSDRAEPEMKWSNVNRPVQEVGPWRQHNARSQALSPIELFSPRQDMVLPL